MTAKYQPLRQLLDDAPPDEQVSLTFEEIDDIVGGLPSSARRHRPWWANTLVGARPHAYAWLGAGRRVSEVRLGRAVVFSPTDDSIQLTTAGRRTRSTEPSPRAIPVLDGVQALGAVVERADFPSIAAAVAAYSVFLHPDTVTQAGEGAMFPVVRDPARRGQFGELPDGTPVLYDDNTVPKLSFLWAAQRVGGPDIQFNHVWGDPRNPATYTALWNVCVTPAFLAKTTDGSNHPEVLAMLRYRAFDLFGCLPDGEEHPSRPASYDTLAWLDSPPPVDDLEAVFRRRLAEAPKGRPAQAARRLGWLFNAGRPDHSLPGGGS